MSLTWQWQSISSPLLWSILENTFALGSVASNYQSYLRNPLVCLQVSKYQSCLLALLIFVALKLQQNFFSFLILSKYRTKKLARHFLGSTPLICREIYHPRHFARRAEACGKGACWEVGFVRVGEWNKGGLAEVFLGGEHDGAEQEGNTSDLAALHFVLGKQLSWNPCILSLILSSLPSLLLFGSWGRRRLPLQIEFFEVWIFFVFSQLSYQIWQGMLIAKEKLIGMVTKLCESSRLEWIK